MLKLAPQKQNPQSFMCVSSGCLCVFQQAQQEQHQNHDYFNVDETISSLIEGQKNLRSFIQLQENDIQQLQDQVLQKNEANAALNKTIEDTEVLIKNLDNGDCVFIKQNLLFFNKMRSEQDFLTSNKLHETRQLKITQTQANNLIESAPLFEYPNFQTLFKNISEKKFIVEEIQEQDKLQCQTHQKPIEYLIFKKYLPLGERTGCRECITKMEGPALSLKKCMKLIEELVLQENTLENIIKLSKNVKSYRNNILRSLKHLTNFLDQEIKNASEKLIKRQNKDMIPENEFKMSNYQLIGEMLSDNISQLGKEIQVEQVFSEKELLIKVDRINQFIEELNKNYISFTAGNDLQKLFTEQSEKYRLIVEVVKNKIDQVKTFKGYEIMVPKDQQIYVLINWIKQREGFNDNAGVHITRNYVQFKYGLEQKWEDCKTKNGAIIHLLFS